MSSEGTGVTFQGKGCTSGHSDRSAGRAGAGLSAASVLWVLVKAPSPSRAGLLALQAPLMVGARAGCLSSGGESVGSSAVAPAACGESLWVPLLIRLLNASSAEKKAPIVILALTDGTLLPFPFEETKMEVSPVHCYQYFAPHIW